MKLNKETFKELQNLEKDRGILLEGAILNLISNEEDEIVKYINKAKDLHKKEVRRRLDVSQKLQREQKIAEENQKKAEDLSTIVSKQNKELSEKNKKLKDDLITQQSFNLKNKQTDQNYFLRQYSMYFLIGVIILFTLKGFIVTSFLGYYSQKVNIDTLNKIIVILNGDLRSLENISLIIVGALITVFTQQSFKNKGHKEDTILSLNESGKLQTTKTNSDYESNIYK